MFRPVKTIPVENSRIQRARQIYFDLCTQFLAANPQHEFRAYIESSIANDATLDRHIRALELYAPYVRPDMTTLDWGCRHAPDSCLLRSLYPELEISGCDFTDNDFSIFHDYAKLHFEQLQHEYRIPSPDQTFDAVISSGVLEHTAFEYESLLEVWRILKKDGLFFVTFLPNSSSWTEKGTRLMGSFTGHTRLYNLDQTKNMFLRSGFAVERCGYHQVFPTFAKSFKGANFLTFAANGGARLNRTFERIPILNRVSSNLFFILRRVSAF